MSKKKKRDIALYAVTLACGLIAIFITYSCSNDEYHMDDEMQTTETVNGPAKARALWAKMPDSGNALIDSIAASDEFWEFKRSTKLLADKFGEATSMLNDEEFDQLAEDLNNDDYAEEFAKRAGLTDALQQVEKAQEELYQNTGFARLSDEERWQLFARYAGSDVPTEAKPMKTRGEGSHMNDCERQKQAAYEQAKTNYENEIDNCKRHSASPVCATQAANKYQRDKEVADITYKKCIAGK